MSDAALEWQIGEMAEDIELKSTQNTETTQLLEKMCYLWCRSVYATLWRQWPYVPFLQTTARKHSIQNTKHTGHQNVFFYLEKHISVRADPLMFLKSKLQMQASGKNDMRLCLRAKFELKNNQSRSAAQRICVPECLGRCIWWGHTHTNPSKITQSPLLSFCSSFHFFSTFNYLLFFNQLTWSCQQDRININEWFLPALSSTSRSLYLPLLWWFSVQPSEGSSYLLPLHTLTGVMLQTVKAQSCTAHLLVPFCTTSIRLLQNDHRNLCVYAHIKLAL